MNNKIDPIYEFMNENIRTGNSYDEIKGIDLYNAYTKWAIENNKFLCTNTRFGLEFSKHFKKIKRHDGVYYNRCIMKNKTVNKLLKESYYNYLFNECLGNYDEMEKIVDYINIKIKEDKENGRKIKEKKEWWEK